MAASSRRQVPLARSSGRRRSPETGLKLISGAVIAVALVFTISLIASAIGGFRDDNASSTIPGAATTRDQVSGLVDDSDETPAPTPADAEREATPAATTADTPSADSTATPTEPAVAAIGDPPTARPLTVCLDVGHGGIDWGFTLTNDEDTVLIAMEKDLVLEQSLDIEARLKEEGFNVVLTRRADHLVNIDGEDINGDGKIDNLDELQARVNVCNAAGADLLVSVHVNGAANTNLQGYESWWAEVEPHARESEWFARRMEQEFGAQFSAAGFTTMSRGAADDTQVDIPDGTGTFKHYVMLSPDVPERNFVGGTMPGSVVEALFLSNAQDLEILMTEAGHDAIVTAYVIAIVDYFEQFPEPIDNQPEPGDPILRWLPAEHQPPVIVEGEPASVAQVSTGATPSRRATPTVSVMADTATPEGAATPDGVLIAGMGDRPAPPPDPGTGSSVIVRGGSGERQEISLTFDAGADRGYAAEILDFLDERGLKASFGITGQWAEQNPDLVIRMVDEGHHLINHTYTHGSFTGFSTPWNPGDPGTSQRLQEIERTDEIIFELTGYDMKPYFRPPYGDYGPQSLQDIYDAGHYLTIMWTVDSYGWKGWSAAEIAEHCIRNATPGGILLFHVGADSDDLAALPFIIDELSADGYEFVTVEELLQE